MGWDGKEWDKMGWSGVGWVGVVLVGWDRVGSHGVDLRLAKDYTYRVLVAVIRALVLGLQCQSKHAGELRACLLSPARDRVL